MTWLVYSTRPHISDSRAVGSSRSDITHSITYVSSKNCASIFTWHNLSYKNSFNELQGGKDSQDPLSCRSLATKEPLNIGHFCGKWPIHFCGSYESSPPCIVCLFDGSLIQRGVSLQKDVPLSLHGMTSYLYHMSRLVHHCTTRLIIYIDLNHCVADLSMCMKRHMYKMGRYEIYPLKIFSIICVQKHKAQNSDAYLLNPSYAYGVATIIHHMHMGWLRSSIICIWGGYD